MAASDGRAVATEEPTVAQLGQNNLAARAVRRVPLGHITETDQTVDRRPVGRQKLGQGEVVAAVPHDQLAAVRSEGQRHRHPSFPDMQQHRRLEGRPRRWGGRVGAQPLQHRLLPVPCHHPPDPIAEHFGRRVEWTDGRRPVPECGGQAGRRFT